MHVPLVNESQRKAGGSPSPHKGGHDMNLAKPEKKENEAKSKILFSA